MTFSGIKLWSHYILKYNHKIICREGHAYNFEHETVTEKNGGYKICINVLQEISSSG